MTAEQLRNSILQEAISGRLVPQDPNDEPASALLARIREEKARLVKEGKLKKKDLEETPIAEDEIPFDIPSSWVWGRLKFFCSRFSTGPFGTMAHKEDYVENNGHNLINPTNIKQRKIIADGIKQVSEAKYKELNSYVLAFNDLVLARRGDLSKIAIVSKKEEGWLAGTGAFFMHFYDGIYLPYFIYLYTSPFCQNYLLQQSVGGTMDNLNQKLLADFIFPLPPLAEQKRIVAKLEELLPIVDQYGKAQTELDQLNAALPMRLRNSLLQEAIQGKLVQQNADDELFAIHDIEIIARKQEAVKAKILKKKDVEIVPITDDEIPFEIPANWKWYRLQDLANMYTGDSINAEQKLKYYTNVKGMEYIGTKDVKFNHDIDYANGIAIPDERRDKFRIAPANSILLCVEGGSAGRKIGTVDRDVCFGNKLCCFATYYDINRYLYYYLQSPMFRDVFRNSITGIIGGVAVNTLKQLLIPMPPLAEQQRIVAKIEELFAEIDKLK